ncbi:MAG: hypothetical protein HY820_11015 [Acidobacteria bacterium]|nr:hypothetical protein [Acidobacteriota bacterium]
MISAPEKLRPDQDLQCYFERPSAIAALSYASASGFTVSGTWRQAFDWAVVEWNRDNVFEHPMFRNLPDGDLSGLTLTYEESRVNCMLVDSAVYPTVDWPYLRIWASTGGSEQVYKVKIKDHAEAIEGSHTAAYADFVLGGSITSGDYIGLTWNGEQYNYQVSGSDTLATAATALGAVINSLSTTVAAGVTGTTIRLTLSSSAGGHNSNRLGVYGFVSDARTETWTPQAQAFTGGTSPTKWRVTIPFGNLLDIEGNTVPTGSVRKLRWTYAADWQAGEYVRSEFSVTVSNWTVTGSGRAYQVAGPGSVRVEERNAGNGWAGTWETSVGNFSDGRIRYTVTPDSICTIQYTCGQNHTLYLGTRYSFNATTVGVRVDGGSEWTRNLLIPGEDVLARVAVGQFNAGSHTVTIRHAGLSGEYLYVDFVEAAIPASSIRTLPERPLSTLATDWDTDHSIALAPERAARNIRDLGFVGRGNHYVGALWFYELVRQGHSYASATVTFYGTPVFSEWTTITINRTGLPSGSATVFSHLNLIGETGANVAKAFELLINNGSTGIRASAAGAVLTIYSRTMGEDGNNLTVAVSPASGTFYGERSGENFSGGEDGDWRTDLTATPRINRAVRDWTRAYLEALDASGIDCAVAFSMELQHGDPEEAAGIAQRYPSGNAVSLNTPAIQTNFSPTSFAFWKQVYLDMADLMAAAGVQPYLQFGEVQWWYFPYDGSGLPFHDAYTKSAFLTEFGFPIRTVVDGTANPDSYPQEAAFLPQLIGSFTDQMMSFVRATHANCRFEVLYPTDVNEGAFNRVINYAPSWDSGTLDCLKTESFTYTGSRNLDQCLGSMQFSAGKGFSRSKRSHLIGISDPTSCWAKEFDRAEGSGIESVVLFAFDQFCLVGYPLPWTRRRGRSGKMGK